MSLTHPKIKDGWFSEESSEFPGQALQLRVKEILHVEQSDFQDVLVFKSTDYGNVLALDGVIQATERDEFAYQEMITHVALNSHPEPKKVLVIGGGDGGVLREVVKHSVVEKALLVEIDESVITLAKKYLPGMAKGFDHPKVEYKITDGLEYLKTVKNEFDVIITDSSDPDGPAEVLFQTTYFKLMDQALTDRGVFITQASENVWLRLNLLKSLKQACKEVFPSVEYTHCCVPTYTSGQLGLMICSKNPDTNLRVPLRTQKDESMYQYYNKHIHESSFVVPTFARKALQ